MEKGSLDFCKDTDGRKRTSEWVLRWIAKRTAICKGLLSVAFLRITGGRRNWMGQYKRFMCPFSDAVARLGQYNLIIRRLRVQKVARMSFWSWPCVVQRESSENDNFVSREELYSDVSVHKILCYSNILFLSLCRLVFRPHFCLRPPDNRVCSSSVTVVFVYIRDRQTQQTVIQPGANEILGIL